VLRPNLTHLFFPPAAARLRSLLSFLSVHEQGPPFPFPLFAQRTRTSLPERKSSVTPHPNRRNFTGGRVFCLNHARHTQALLDVPHPFSSPSLPPVDIRRGQIPAGKVKCSVVAIGFLVPGILQLSKVPSPSVRDWLFQEDLRKAPHAIPPLQKIKKSDFP